MNNRNYFSKEERAARSRAVKLVHRGLFIYGSIVTSKRTCGKVRCRCHQAAGRGHESSYLSVKIGKKRKLIFIPNAMMKKATALVRSYKDLKRDIQVISESSVMHMTAGR